jgi:thymidylate kinase
MQTTKEARLILKKLTKAGIKYVLIRNFDCLVKNKPYDEKDIDILISKKDNKKINKLMQEQRFKKLLICPAAGHQGFVKYVNRHFLSVHLHVGGVSGANIPYLDAESVLSRKKEKNSLFIPSEEDRLLALLLHGFLDSCTFKPRYCRKMTMLLKKDLDFDYISLKISEISNKKFADKIIKYLKQENYKKLEKIRKKFRAEFANGSKSRKIHLLKSKIIKYAWMAKRFFMNAPLVSFIGMDGTGKTTQTNLLKQRLDNSLITNAVIYTGRGRNNILPIQFFGQKYEKIEKKRQNNKNQDKKDQTSLKKKIIYTLAAPVFAFDLFLRYWVVIWPTRKIKQIVITDRYSTDILLMANVPMLFKKIMYPFFPKPSLTVYLYNDPKILCRRKKGHPLEDLYRQKRIFSKINKKIKPWKIKSEEIDKIVEKISRKILNSLI